LGALERCLESLEKQTLNAALFEIIVVDNGSALSPEPIVSRHARAKLLYEPVPGPGPARNCGVRAAAGEMLCFIDADCRAAPDCLANGMRELSSVPARTIVGGDVHILEDPGSPVTAIQAYESVFGYRQQNYIEEQGFSVMANLAVRRTDFDAVGPIGGINVAE